MAVIWTEGFEVFRTTGALARRYISTTFNVTFGNGRLVSTRTSLRSTDAFSSLRLPVQGDLRHWTIGIAAFVDRMEEGMKLIRTMKGGVEQVRLQFKDDGTGTGFKPELVVGPGSGTVVWTAGASFPYGFWYYFELKVDHQSTATGSVQLQVNEFLLVNLTNIVTAPDGTAENVAFDLEHKASGGLVALDDIVIQADASSAQAFLGDCEIAGALPTADFLSQWSRSTGATNSALVDDADEADDDSTYVYVNGDNFEDLYETEDVSLAGSIIAVAVHTDVRLAASGARNLQHRVESGGSKSGGAIKVVSGTSYGIVSTIFAQNPVTASAWSLSEVNAARFGQLSSP